MKIQFLMVVTTNIFIYAHRELYIRNTTNTGCFSLLSFSLVVSAVLHVYNFTIVVE